jgi:AraC family transcriptional regulator
MSASKSMGNSSLAVRGVQRIAGGRYACAAPSTACLARCVPHVRFMSEWMPDSDYGPADGPTIEIYGKDFLVYEKTGAFSCQLCMPMRSA